MDHIIENLKDSCPMRASLDILRRYTIGFCIELGVIGP